MVLACVLECSTIGSMILLTVVIAITRMGTNKDTPEGDQTRTPVGPPAPDTPPPVADRLPGSAPFPPD